VQSFNVAEARRDVVTTAAEHGITLALTDVVYVGGQEFTIGGMPSGQWLDAMTMD
jgi:hypothetical protein